MNKKKVDKTDYKGIALFEMAKQKHAECDKLTTELIEHLSQIIEVEVKKSPA